MSQYADIEDEKQAIEKIITGQYRAKFMPVETADNFSEEFAEEPPEDALYKHAQQHAIPQSREEASFIASFEQLIHHRETQQKESLEHSLPFKTPTKRRVSPWRPLRSSSRRFATPKDMSSSKQIDLTKFNLSVRGSHHGKQQSSAHLAKAAPAGTLCSPSSHQRATPRPQTAASEQPLQEDLARPSENSPNKNQQHREIFLLHPQTSEALAQS